MSITATFISTTQFAVNGDQTSIFMEDRRVKANCGGTYKYGTITDVSYVPSITTITLSTASDDLDATLTEVEVGIVSAGAESSIPIHSHDGSEGSGGPVSLEGAVFHNSIGGLQGGTTDEYYHITAADFIDFITATEVDTISGALQSSINSLTPNHALLTNLSYANSGHTGFQPSGDYATNSGVNTISGVLQYNIDNLFIPTDFYSRAETDAISGTLHNEILTASGSLQDQLDNLSTDHGDLIGLLDDDHPQYALTSGTRNITGPQTFESNVVIRGNLIVSGTQFITETEDVLIEDHLLTINYGEVGAGISFPYAGIEVDRGSETNYLFVYDETDDNFQIGVSGSLQAVATREDTPTTSGFAYWNPTQYRFDTSTTYTTDTMADKTYVSTVSGTLQTSIDELRASSAGVIYYLVDIDDTTVSGYELMQTAPAVGAEDTDVVSLTNNNETLVGQYITTSGLSLGTVIPGGVWDFVFYGKLDNLNATTVFIAKVYTYTSSGTENLLFSTSSADINSLTAIDVEFATYQPDFVIASTDRLVLKIYAQTTSVQTIGVTYYYQGTERYSHFKTPISALIVSDHGALQGLLDDDHPQYALSTELDAVSGTLQSGINNISITTIAWNVPTASGTYQGITSTATVSGCSLGFGNALYLKSDGYYYDAYATVSGQAPCHALATTSGTGSKTIFKMGYIRNDAWNFTPGYPIYLSTTSGSITQTAVSGTGQIVQILGHAETGTTIWFNPNIAVGTVK